MKSESSVLHFTIRTNHSKQTTKPYHS